MTAPCPDDPALDADVRRLDEFIAAVGRRSCLRDPIATLVEEMNLTPAQVHAVLWLGRDGRLTMGELAQRVGVTEKTVTGLVDRLERDHYVVRGRDELDRRVVHVHLTEHGAAVARELQARLTEKVRAILGLLSAEERAQLLHVTERIGEQLQQLHHDARSDSPGEGG